jgi:hypothetical protein
MQGQGETSLMRQRVSEEVMASTTLIFAVPASPSELKRETPHDEPAV